MEWSENAPEAFDAPVRVTIRQAGEARLISIQGDGLEELL